MVGYIVFNCPRCGLVRYAREGQKTAKCLRCNYNIQITPEKIRILARVEDVKDAIDIVKAYKARLKS
ncbi:MAG: DUF1922 domain-containing protein [Candidatus Bathyarchaeota archaeon]|nr:DUF1922 domain-containing protein [Candidatus Bathyarchaeota archaeon]